MSTVHPNPRPLRAVLEAAGVSQHDFAKQLDAHPSQVSRWVREEALPRRFWRREIARVLNIDESEIAWPNSK